jgi:ABC-type glycerol-3-phosphate transport system permease component
MRLADVMLAFPQMVLAIAVAGILGGGMINAMLALGITGWTLYARLARAQVLALKKEPYVQAARLSGCSALRIMTTTLLPNMLGPLVVNAATQIGVMMIGIAGLSFLGIGVTEPQAEWGNMINLSRAYVQLAPWAVLAPAMATMGIMGFIGNWNNYLLPMIILNKNDKFTLPAMMATLRASLDIQANQGAIYLAVALSVIPILMVFCFFSRYIISSISAGAVKG